jgi:hypothetical protein
VISSATSGFDSVLVENFLAAFAIGGCALATYSCRSVGEPIFGGATLGIVACCAFAGRSEIDNLRHIAVLNFAVLNAG